MNTRRGAFYTAAGTLLILCYALSKLDWGREKPVERIIGFALLVPVGVAVTLLWPREVSRRKEIAGLLVLAVTARLLLLPHLADSDVNRYLWEGRLIRSGESPYAHAAADPAWRHLRDEYWPGMNQKDLTTIYPPLAQWIFAAVGGLWYRPIALKIIFMLFDAGVIALVLALLATRGLPLRLAGLYAFNPVPLVGFAGEGHFDSMMLFFVLLAVWLRARRKSAWSWVALGLAVQMKVVAVLLVPLLLRRGGWRMAWLGALTAALPFVPYRADFPAWIEGVRHFGGDFAFNGSIHALAWKWLGDSRTAAALCGLLLALWVVGVARLHRDTARAAFWILGGLIVFAPTVHYWYLAWALMFVPLFPSVAWLTLTATIALCFLGRSTGLASWAQITIWSSFGLVLLREAKLAVVPLVRNRRRAALSPVRTLAIVVPALNEAKSIRGCLESLAQMSPPADEIIVADGGSIDATRDIAAEFGTPSVLTKPSRGRQIAAGVDIARSDAVLIVHADSFIAQDTRQRVLAALNSNPDVIGGAIGQQFDGNSLKLTAIELLNEIRALFFGMSFGDQGQFFRRPALLAAGGFPTLPLMEDVEFSLRARALGRVLYLGGGVISSDRRWRSEGWLKRCAVVITMTALYRMKRRGGERLAGELYQRYYPSHA